VPDTAVEVEDLRKVFRHSGGLLRRSGADVDALRGISLRAGRGELLGLLGPNGAGKTTTVRILTTLLLPTSGTVRVLGLDVTRDTTAVRRLIGFVLGGERGLYTRLSAWDNLVYFSTLYQVPPDVARRRIRGLLDLLGLSGREHEPVERFSRGMKQRLHLAKGLVNDPEVLFLDEPTMGLDPGGARELRSFVRQLADQGKTIFLTTHYMLEADAICDRVALINRGAIVAEGTPSELKQRVAHMGVVVFEVAGLPHDRLERLRSLPDVVSVAVTERELTHVITVQCSDPAPLAARLPTLLEDAVVSNLHVGEPTLEDAYLLMVGS
jgi:ABC-2 type transport system ATP-binding protein